MIKFIENIGDYFSSNYFDEDFIKSVFNKSSFSEDDRKEINRLVSPLKDKYYKYKNEHLTLKRPKDRIKLTNSFHSDVLKSFGYESEANDYDNLYILNDEKNEGIPVRLKLYRKDTPHLFVMEMQSMIVEGDNDPPGIFDQRYDSRQWEYVFAYNKEEVELSPKVVNEALKELFLIDEHFRPTYVLLLAGSDIYLTHYEKYLRGSYLRFKLEDLFDEASAINRDYYTLFYLLLSKDSLSPESELILMDQLDEDSHKSAYAVTKDLKEGVIKAVEDLANESVYYLDSINQLDSLDENFAEQVKDDCLTIVYRLLFLFYAESRDELEILPVNESVYKNGYSLEMLRDLELVPLQSESAKNGYFFDQSLKYLFRLIAKGFEQNRETTKSFTVRNIDSPLFDDGKLNKLQDVKFRNFVWQDILRQLSLSQKVRGKSRGRISYANLGINQLGSVYESLLAYKGFFAGEDYIEVKKADDPTGKDGTYVVPRKRRGDFEEEEILKDPENPELDKIIPKGFFIYRLSGRDRQKSASYYTPEVLTRTTVKYTLKPILEKLEKGEIKAKDLLDLKILEPAMGAAAFHNEVINQLAEAYLNQFKRDQTPRIPPGIYQDELQKVKAYIATRNVYGVDINPTAVELGKISLWLNVIHKQMETPFFGYRLGVGNAVVGAWRKVYSKEQIIFKPTNASGTRYEKREWWNEAPKHLPMRGHGSKRKKNEIYHFLLPDKNMVPSANIKMLKDEYTAQAKKVREWRSEFIKPIRADEFISLLIISDKIDGLYEEHYKLQTEINNKTYTRVKVWGQSGADQTEIFNYSDKEDFAHLRDKTNAAYYKLKTIMDYWCALWFWDMRDADALPSREEYISDLLNILDIDIEKALQENSEEADDILGVETEPELDLDGKQLSLLAYKSDSEKSIVAELIAKKTEVTTFFKTNRIALIENYSKQYRFFHYELEFIEVFKERSGFDVIVGNPPWVSIGFDENSLLSDKFPEVSIRKFNVTEVRNFLNRTLKQDKFLSRSVKNELVEVENYKNYSGSIQNNQLTFNQRNNIYKSIIGVSFSIIGVNGFIGVLHPEGVYDDPRGHLLRQKLYKRLRFHFQFINSFLLFAEVHDQLSFSINIYSGIESQVNFETINNLFHPSTIDGCYVHDGKGICPGFKKILDNGNTIWNTSPHKNRIVNITEKELRVISNIFEENDYLSTKFVSLQSNEIIQVLAKINAFTGRVDNHEFKVTDCWNDATAVRNGIIKPEVKYPQINNYEYIISGPHFFVANPLHKTPREHNQLNCDYDIIDLNAIDIDYVSRTRYIPNRDIDEFIKIHKGFIVNADENDRPIYDNWIDHTKCVFSKMINLQSERSLQPSIALPKVSHMGSVISIVFKDELKTIEFASCSASILYDFLLKTLGRSNLYEVTLKKFPLGINNKYFRSIMPRILRLNCVNNYYSILWEKYFQKYFRDEQWSIEDKRLADYGTLNFSWNFNTPLRNAFERRTALVEIDVIVALAFNLTLEELILIYNTQFYVLNQNETSTFYDRKGNIVFTANKGLTGVGLSRTKWEEVKNNKEGEIVEHTVEYELHRGTKITYYPPFENCDRVGDYRIAWAHFEKVFADKE